MENANTLAGQKAYFNAKFRGAPCVRTVLAKFSGLTEDLLDK
jgi:hypothetical protein